jgi:hypothetical protein
VELAIAPLDWTATAYHAVVPKLAGLDALTLAVAIVGATVMPHAIYLHSGLTQDRIVPRSDGERRKLIRFSNIEVIFALGLAGLVNMAMVAVAASVFHDPAHASVARIETAHRLLEPLLGVTAAAVFLVSLIASGLSSSVVATMAGQVIMQDFVGFRIPLWVRRLVTMVPSFVVVALGADTLRALVASQVVLSVVLPVPMIALLIITRQESIMGAAVNGRFTAAVGALAAGLVLCFNGLLLLELCGLAPSEIVQNPPAAVMVLATTSLLLLLIRESSKMRRPLPPLAGSSMVLTVVEHEEGGAVIPRGSPASWTPRMILPAGIDAPKDPASGGVRVPLPADWLDAIGLQVSPPPGASGTHLFHIIGSVDGRNATKLVIALRASGGV